MITIGSKVTVRERYEDCPWKIGTVGTVVTTESSRGTIGVRFEESKYEGHDLNGFLPSGYKANGWWFHEDYLDFEVEPTIDEFKVGDIVSLPNEKRFSSFSVYRVTLVTRDYISVLDDNFVTVPVRKIYASNLSKVGVNID
jgi:hypothetical protein